MPWLDALQEESKDLLMRFSSRTRRSLSKTTDGSGGAHLSAAKAGAEDRNGASSSVSSTQSTRKAAEDEELQ